MPSIKHFYKADNILRGPASSLAELTDYTIAWSDLTTAGLAAGDDVLILVAVKVWASNAATNTFFTVGFGTTFAGRVEEANSVSRSEPVATSAGDQYLWFDRRTLVTNENIYFRSENVGGASCRYQNFRCLIVKLGDLTANDFVYAEAGHSGDAPTAYDTSGAGASIPQTGDWLLVACSRWLVDSVTADMLLAINDGSADISEVRTEGEDVDDQRVFGTWAYKAALASGTTVRARYRADTAASQDAATTKIFGLRLGAFEDHAGLQTADTITHSVLDTYQEFAGFGSYSLTTTGPFLVIGWPIHDYNTASTPEATKRPYGRIQIGGSDWPAVDNDRVSIGDNGANAIIAPLVMGYNASQSAATLDIDLDCAEDADIAPTYACDVQVAVAFSLTLAAPTPIISSIDSDNDTVDTRTGIPIVGANFGSAGTGSFKVEVSNNSTYGAGTIVQITRGLQLGQFDHRRDGAVERPGRARHAVHAAAQPRVPVGHGQRRCAQRGRLPVHAATAGPDRHGGGQYHSGDPAQHDQAAAGAGPQHRG